MSEDRIWSNAANPMIGTHYARGPAPWRAPVDHVRPLCIGAAFEASFHACAPEDWKRSAVLADLFVKLQLDDAGWDIDFTHTKDMGVRNGSRYWLIWRNEA